MLLAQARLLDASTTTLLTGKNMSVNPNLKIFECGEYVAIFNGDDMTLKLLPLKKYSFSSQGQTNLNSVLPVHASEIYKNEGKIDERPAIHRLSLNVSNLCNMACKYCYANGGNYYTNGMLMDKRTAFNSVNFAYRNFSAIELINFFGGEPTLNEEIIELVCEFCIYLHAKGMMPYLPRFGLTTNGYIISSRMFDLLRRYNFSVSVSTDGPKMIHDKFRISKEHSGTFDAVANNIRSIIRMGIIPEFECTYTSEHYRMGIDLAALMDFFYDNFGCRTLHCPMVIAESNSPLPVPLNTAVRLYSDAIRYSIHNLMDGVPKSISIATRLLNNLTNRIPIYHYCPAGKSSITVNADGNIYACFMLMRGRGFCFGNVNGNCHEFGNPNVIGILLENADKWKDPDCQSCWAKSLCFGCLGEDIARGGTAIQRSVILGQSGICDSKRKLIEVFLMSVADAYVREETKQEEACL